MNTQYILYLVVFSLGGPYRSFIVIYNFVTRSVTRSVLQWGTSDAEVKDVCWKPRTDICSPFKAWSRSEYSHACFAHCQEFLFCLNSYLHGPFTFIFFPSGDAKGSVIQRRTQRPGSDVDLAKFSQELGCSANDDLIAETRCFVFHSLIYGELAQSPEKRYGVFCSMTVKHASLAAEFCTCWRGLLTVWEDSVQKEIEAV